MNNTDSNLLHFTKDANDGRTALARNFLGAELTSSTGMQISFNEEDGTLDAMTIAMTFTGPPKEAYKALAGALGRRSRGTLTVVGDVQQGTFISPFNGISSITA